MSSTWSSASRLLPTARRSCSAAVHHLEQLAGHMYRGSDTARRKVDLARIGLGVGNELGHARHWDRRVHLHHIGHAQDASDRRAVAHDVETELVIDGSVDRVVWT